MVPGPALDILWVPVGPDGDTLLPRGVDVNRSQVLAIALLAAGLVLRGDARPPGDAVASATPDGAFGVERIAAIMGETNLALTAEETQRIAYAVLRSSRAHSLEPQLVTAVILVESSARPWARSPKGAVGLMQVMPRIASSLELAGNLTTIENNIEAGCTILADNIRRLGEDDGISAYFWGSNIRGVAYLDRVRQVRAAVVRHAES